MPSIPKAQRPSATIQAAPAAISQPAANPRWLLPAIAAVFALCLFAIYEPSISGPFVFDDMLLPMHVADKTELRAWMSGVRPILMVSYWVNYQLSGLDPTSYHVVNLLFHLLNSLLVFVISRKLAGGVKAGIFAAAWFLIHPIQTESVSYIAGRSESLAALFMLLAIALFVHRGESCSWIRSLGILFCFGLACTSKEHAVALAPLFVFLDLYKGGMKAVRANWRLYVPLLTGAALAVIYVLRILSQAETAGFNMLGVTPWQYFLTQCRVIPQYLLLLVLPVDQAIDHEFPMTKGNWDTAAIGWLLLFMGAAWAAWKFRRRYPEVLLGIGWFAFLLSPTSSIVPIADAMAERRLYLPMVGAAFVLIPLFRPLQTYVRAPVLALIAIALSVITWQRNHAWSDPVLLWQDLARSLPSKIRIYSQYSDILVARGLCNSGLPTLKAAIEKYPKQPRLHMYNAKLLQCVNRPKEALAELQTASALEDNSLLQEMTGLLLASMGETYQARQHLERAVQMDPSSIGAHMAMGLLLESVQDYNGALQHYQQALILNPRHQPAERSMERIRGLTK